MKLFYIRLVKKVAGQVYRKGYRGVTCFHMTKNLFHYYYLPAPLGLFWFNWRGTLCCVRLKTDREKVEIVKFSKNVGNDRTERVWRLADETDCEKASEESFDEIFDML